MPPRNVVRFLTIWLTLEVFPVLPAGDNMDFEGGEIESRRCLSIANANVFEPMACNRAALGIAAIINKSESRLKFLELLEKKGTEVDEGEGTNLATPPCNRHGVGICVFRFVHSDNLYFKT